MESRLFLLRHVELVFTKKEVEEKKHKKWLKRNAPFKPRYFIETGRFTPPALYNAKTHEEIPTERWVWQVDKQPRPDLADLSIYAAPILFVKHLGRLGFSENSEDMLWLKDQQRKYPHIEIVLDQRNPHFLSFKYSFWSGFAGAIMDPTKMTLDNQRYVVLPSGTRASRDKKKGTQYEKQWAAWATRLGVFAPEAGVKVQAVYHYNLFSACFGAAKLDMRVRDFDTTRILLPIGIRSDPGRKATDKLLCDTCTLAPYCLVAREGAVCVLNDELDPFIENLGSRDAGDILKSMRAILMRKGERMRGMLEREQAALDADADGNGEYSKEVSKEMDSTFEMAKKMAQLLDPTLGRPAPTTTVIVANQGQPAGPTGPEIARAAGPVKAQISEARRQMRLEGWAEEEITGPAIANYLGTESAQVAIESATIIEEEPPAPVERDDPSVYASLKSSSQ